MKVCKPENMPYSKDRNFVIWNNNITNINIFLNKRLSSAYVITINTCIWYKF